MGILCRFSLGRSRVLSYQKLLSDMVLIEITNIENFQASLCFWHTARKSLQDWIYYNNTWTLVLGFILLNFNTVLLLSFDWMLSDMNFIYRGCPPYLIRENYVTCIFGMLLSQPCPKFCTFLLKISATYSSSCIAKGKYKIIKTYI